MVNGLALESAFSYVSTDSTQLVDLYLAPLIGLFRSHYRVSVFVEIGIRVASHRTVQSVQATGFIENAKLQCIAADRTTAHTTVQTEG